MFSLAVFAVVIAAAMAKPTDTVVSVNQDSLGNYALKYTIDDRSKVALIQPQVLRTAELATPTLIAKPSLPAYNVLQEIPAVRATQLVEPVEVSKIRTSQYTSVQQEIPVLAERKIEVPAYRVLEAPAVRTAHFAEQPRFEVVQVPQIPAVRSNFATVQQQIPVVAERNLELPTYRVLEVPAVRSNHFTVQKEIPLVAEPRLEIPSYRVLEVPQVPAVRANHLSAQHEVPVLSHSYLRSLPTAHIAQERHFSH